MSRESRIFFSRLIIAGVFLLSILAAVTTHFLITLITVTGGILSWLLYLLSAGLGTDEDSADSEAALGRNISKVVAGLGLVLAISAFVTYGVERTMWGSYIFDLSGVAIAMLILLVTIAPLVIIQLTRLPGSRPRVPAPQQEDPLPAQPYSPPPLQPAPVYVDEGEYFEEDDDDEEGEDEWDEKEEEEEEEEDDDQEDE